MMMIYRLSRIEHSNGMHIFIYLTWLDPMRPDPTRPDSIRSYPTRLDSTWLDPTLLDPTLADSTRLNPSRSNLVPDSTLPRLMWNGANWWLMGQTDDWWLVGQTDETDDSQNKIINAFRSPSSSDAFILPKPWIEPRYWHSDNNDDVVVVDDDDERRRRCWRRDKDTDCLQYYARHNILSLDRDNANKSVDIAVKT